MIESVSGLIKTASDQYLKKYPNSIRFFLNKEDLKFSKKKDFRKIQLILTKILLKSKIM